MVETESIEEIYDENEEAEERRVYRKGRRRVWILIGATVTCILIIVGIILAIVLSGKKSPTPVLAHYFQHKNLGEGITFLTIAFYNSNHTVLTKDYGLDETKDYIIESITSPEWKSYIEIDQNLVIRFMPYTNQTLALTEFSTNVKDILNNFYAIQSSNSVALPSQVQVTSEFLTNISKVQLQKEHNFMLYTPSLSAYGSNKRH
uniref:SEA domain-containing protein n=1 Tax=Panagrolaimus sp. PS1159 TaxID=55785 RepID=A0AC35GY23_9BILA